MSRLPKCIDPLGVKNCYIAGGAVLSVATKTGIADYDYYPKNQDGLESVIEAVMADGFITHISDRAITFKYNGLVDSNGDRVIIQVMTYSYFTSPQQIFDNFDFTVCMGAFDCDDQQYTFHDDFFPDIASKTLRFHEGTLYPLNSLIRVNKYRNKGFYISKPETVKMALAVAMKGVPSSWDELESSVGGSYGRQIIMGAEGIDFSMGAAFELLSNVIGADFEQDINHTLSIVKFDTFVSYWFAKSYFKHNSSYYSIDEYGDICDVTSLCKEVGPRGEEIDKLKAYVPVKDGKIMKFQYTNLCVSDKDASTLDSFKGPIDVVLTQAEGYIPVEVDVDDIINVLSARTTTIKTSKVKLV